MNHTITPVKMVAIMQATIAITGLYIVSLSAELNPAIEYNKAYIIITPMIAIKKKNIDEIIKLPRLVINWGNQSKYISTNSGVTANKKQIIDVININTSTVLLTTNRIPLLNI